MLKKIMFAILTAILCLPIMPPLVLAQDEETDVSSTNKLKPKTVAVFKNGYGFFVSEGTLEPENDGWLRTDHIPDASLGTLWFEAAGENAIVEEAVSYLEEVKKEVDAISMIELLRANVGNIVKITSRFDSKVITGILKALPESREMEPYSSSYYPPYRDAQFILISTGNEDVAVDINDFARIEFPGNHSTTLTMEEEEKRMKLKVATDEEEATVRLSYFQPGISWVPSYLIDIADESKATITMKATLINDVEALEDAEVYFVVGHPNFTFANILSPMSLELSLAQFITSLQTGGISSPALSGMSHIMSQTAMITSNAMALDTSAAFDYDYAEVAGLSGAFEGDLFLYHQTRVTLDKGERGYYPILSGKVDYEHVFKWDVTNADGDQKVWHFIRLTNSTDHPWTTAPALILSDWKPIAQETIHYTPTRATTDVKLTSAVDIKAESSEIESERDREVKRYGHYYDLVTIEGKLYLENFKSEPVPIEITRDITGDVLEANHEGEIAKEGKRVHRINPDSSISWDISLEPGEDITITYTYQQYI